MSSAHIVIIEDEKAIADTLIHILEANGFIVQWFATAGEGLKYLQLNTVELLILDVGLPDGNGFELCKQIRMFSDLPIIFLTARDDEIDRVVGLEIGADDYVTKPFSPREMLVRVKLRIKGYAEINKYNKPLDCDSELYAENYDYYFKGVALNLTALEYKILDKLVINPKQIFSREQLMAVEHTNHDAIYARNTDSHIKAIRNKLKLAGAAEIIQTKRGFGYYYELIH